MSNFQSGSGQPIQRRRASLRPANTAQSQSTFHMVPPRPYGFRSPRLQSPSGLRCSSGGPEASYPLRLDSTSSYHSGHKCEHVLQQLPNQCNQGARPAALGIPIPIAVAADLTRIESTLKQVRVRRSGLGCPRTQPQLPSSDSSGVSRALKPRLEKRVIILIRLASFKSRKAISTHTRSYRRHHRSRTTNKALVAL